MDHRHERGPRDGVDLQFQNGAAWIVLDRADTLNAMTIAIALRMESILDAIEHDTTVRAVVFTGSGRAFCVGADLSGAAKGKGANQDQAIEVFVEAYNELLNRIEAFPKPMIAALNGMTLGAGLELALACDFIVASDDARIGDGHSRFGLLPGGGASVRLPRRIGQAAAKWMFFSGDFQPLDDLLRWGLVQSVYPAESFRRDVTTLCEQIATCSPLGLARLKTLANGAGSGSIAEALAAEQAMLRLHRSSRDRAEGLDAFKNKRKPVFTGE